MITKRASFLLEKILKTSLVNFKNPLYFALICVFFASNELNYEIGPRYLLTRYKATNPERKFFRKFLNYYQDFLSELELKHPESYMEAMVIRFFQDIEFDEKVNFQGLSLNLARKIRSHTEFSNKSNSLISAVAIFFVFRSQNIEIHAKKIQKYFKVTYYSFTQFLNIIDKKFHMDNKIAKNP